MNRARIGIICGVGLEELCPAGTDLRVGTPFGSPPIMRLASVDDVDAVFLLRRGSRNNQPPHLTNYRANIFGLHELGVERIIGTDVAQMIDVPSRKSEFAIPSDLIDLAGRRGSTFYDEAPVIQIDLDHPFCPEVRSSLLDSARGLDIKVETESVYVCVEGPRFRTPAEIRALKILGGDIVGMDLAPEVFLARELGICYSAVTVLFDGNRGKQTATSAVRLIEAARKSVSTLKEIVTTTIKEVPVRRRCCCTRAPEETII